VSEHPAGRPPLERNRTAGKNLRTALKLLGKTWRKDTDNPNHVRHWSTWTDCGLPGSTNTIDADMRLGVPEKRLAAYSLCLGITPEELCSPKAGMARLMKASSVRAGEQPLFLPGGCADSHFGNWLEFNRATYIKRLFELMGGVWRMDYLLHGVKPIHQCILWIHGSEAHRLLMRGLFIMFGNENAIDAHIFRWHNNLHTHYLCDNGLELGYTLTVDPLRHNIVSKRSPLWLRGTGMTDRGLTDNQPITFMFRETRLPVPEGMTEEAFWQQECEGLRRRPFIAPDDPEHARVRAQILAPEVLTPDE